MRKLHIFGAALVAMLALCAVFAGSAFAEEQEALLAEWLINGVAVAAATAEDLKGEFIFGAEKGTIVQCGFETLGTYNTNGKGEQTEVLNLSFVLVTETAPLLCKSLNICETDETDVEVFPRKFPWKFEVFLMADGTFLVLVEKETWKIKCLVLGLDKANECEFPDTTYELLNTVGGAEIMGFGTPLGNCSEGGAGVGEMEAVPLDLDTSTAGTVSISSQ